MGGAVVFRQGGRNRFVAIAPVKRLPVFKKPVFRKRTGAAVDFVVGLLNGFENFGLQVIDRILVNKAFFHELFSVHQMQ